MRGCLFDLDGVITKTAAQSGGRFVPFDAVADYDAYVDGKFRANVTRSFPASRGVSLPEGSVEDASETVNGLGSRKSDIVLRHIREDGVEVYEGSLRYVRAFRSCGLRCAVVSSSTNCQGVFIAAGIEDLFDQRIDGLTAKREHLTEKPAPGIFLAGAHALGLKPEECVVFEDALAGVAAGRADNSAAVIGVDREGQAQALRDHGADIVVSDLANLLQTA